MEVACEGSPRVKAYAHHDLRWSRSARVSVPGRRGADALPVRRLSGALGQAGDEAARVSDQIEDRAIRNPLLDVHGWEELLQESEASGHIVTAEAPRAIIHAIGEHSAVIADKLLSTPGLGFAANKLVTSIMYLGIRTNTPPEGITVDSPACTHGGIFSCNLRRT
jgi:hypothetical protein